MQINGTITNITPTGGYQSQQGYVYTYNMGIQTNQGAYFGQIGSKSDHYPANIGDDITVDVIQDQHGTKFKKINPAYAGKGQSQSPRQAAAPMNAAPPIQPQPHRPSHSTTADFSAELTRCRGVALSYCIDNTKLNYELNADTYRLAEDIAAWMITGVVPTSRSTSPQGTIPAEGDQIPF